MFGLDHMLCPIKEEDKDPNIDYMSEEEVKALYQWIRVKFY